MLAEYAGSNVAFCVVEGGDDRLTIQPELGMNKYNVPNIPTPGICRGSCTSSGPTPQAFSLGQPLLERLAAQGGPERVAAEVRQRISRVWDLDEAQTSITCFPSGTDAEFLFGLLAHGRAVTLGRGEVMSIVTCKGEVGSGTAQAAACRHFSALLPSGKSASAGTSILPPKSPAMHVQEVTVREATGQLRLMAHVDAEVESIVASELEKEGGRVGCCVVHLVLGCKTGHCSPSSEAIERLSERFGQRVLVVVDGCQGRLQDGAIRQFIDRGYGVLVTGSKFYAGPPFSGAALLGRTLAAELEGYVKPGGICEALVRESQLREYVCAPLSDPRHLPSLCSLLPSIDGCNPGLFRGPLLRWSMALANAEAYHALPASARDSLISSWAQSVKTIAAQEGGRAVQPMQEEVTHSVSASILPVNTIMSLQCQIFSGGAWRKPTVDELRLVHRLMALDLSHRCDGLNAKASASLSRRCFIAQPVALGTACAPVLRVALGAPQVVDAHKECMRSQCQKPFSWPFCDDEKAVVLKLAHILGTWDTWSNRNEAVLRPQERITYEFQCRDRFLQGSLQNGGMQKLLHSLGLEWSCKQFQAVLDAYARDMGTDQLEYDAFIDYILQD